MKFAPVSLLILAACASNLTPEEIEFRNGERAKIWERCQQLGPTISYHSHAKNRQHRPMEIHQDNVINQCYMRVGDLY